MKYYCCVFVLFVLTFGQSKVTGHPAAVDKVQQGLRDEVTSDDQFESMRTKRAVDPKLKAYRDQLFHNLDTHRAQKDLAEFVVDPTLERGAQAWALELASEFNMSTSCVQCNDYSEIIGSRWSSHAIADGAEAGDWVFEKLFTEDEESTYDVIISDPDNHAVGFGISFAQNPEDWTYHAYAVLRFAKTPHLR